MKLQVAIDRVSIEELFKLSKLLDGKVDIIEVGTSLIKDYGLNQLKTIKSYIKSSKVLYDIKTIDEGDYEFRKGFESNADILTVMASSSESTIDLVNKTTTEFNKEMFIDLLEVDDKKIKEISHYPHAIYGLHHSHDKSTNFDAARSVEEFHTKFPNIKRIAVAGGINLDQARKLAHQNKVDTIIVGGSIVNSDNPIAMADKFMEAIK